MTERSQADLPPKLRLQPILRLLIVEDTAQDAELIQLTLEAAAIQFTCQTVDTLQGYQQHLEQDTWDAVLSDFQLSTFTAQHVLELLQRSQQNIPLILVTGELGEEAAVECIKAGITDYVLKDRLFRLPMVLERSLREVELRRQQQATMTQSQQQAAREVIINRIVQSMRGTLVLEEVLQTTVDRLHDALAVSRGVIFLPNKDGQVICHYVSQATEDRESLVGFCCPVINHYRAELTTGNLLCFNRSDNSQPEFIQCIIQRLEVQALLCVPLMYQQDFLGGICLQQCDREREWTDDEVTMVRAIADQCAIALHQTRLFTQIQQQAQREQLLNQIGRSLNSSLDPNHILQEIVKLTGACFQVDRVVIFAIEAGQIWITHEWLASQQVPSMMDFTAPVQEWPELLEAISQANQGQVFSASDYASLNPTPARSELVHYKQVRSVLSVPIFIRNQFFGGLELHTTYSQRTFTDAEIQLLQQIADQAAIALYNAQSYEQLEMLVDERTKELGQQKHLSDAANRAKSEFLANMSHELRTPLTSILGFSSVLLKQIFGSLTDKQTQYLKSIHSSGEHLLALINDLLDLSKIEARQDDLVLETVDISEICQDCIKFVQQQAATKGLLIDLAIAPHIKTCIADQRRLKQILINLLSNAIKFTEMGSVRLIVTQAQHFLHFEVEDTGIGIDESDFSKLFQPFCQLQSGLDRKYQGTGLGLALAQKLAQLHQGTITVTSKLGYGSCFTLRLPAE